MLLMALYNLGAGGVTVNNVLVGMLVFAGGIAQTLVAMWELARGNTLFATCFLTFSTFWISYAAVLIPGFGVMAAYEKVPEQIPKALGLYMFVWFITITSLMYAFHALSLCLTLLANEHGFRSPAVIGKSHMFTVLLSVASTSVLFLSCGMYTEIPQYVFPTLTPPPHSNHVLLRLSTVGNSLLIVVSTLAYYIGIAGLLASDPGSAFTLPLF